MARLYLRPPSKPIPLPYPPSPGIPGEGRGEGLKHRYLWAQLHPPVFAVNLPNGT
jgi:hypothetical protein